MWTMPVLVNVCAWLKSKDPLLMNVDAWKIVINIVTMKNEKCNYFCPVCKLQIDDWRDNSINCNSCLMWLHLKCTGLKKMPKKRYWFCKACKMRHFTLIKILFVNFNYIHASHATVGLITNIIVNRMSIH